MGVLAVTMRVNECHEEPKCVIDEIARFAYTAPAPSSKRATGNEWVVLDVRCGLSENIP